MSPVYQGTFQRFLGVGEFPRDDQMNAYCDMVVQWPKDLERRLLTAPALRRLYSDTIPTHHMTLSPTSMS